MIVLNSAEAMRGQNIAEHHVETRAPGKPLDAQTIALSIMDQLEELNTHKQKRDLIAGFVAGLDQYIQG